MRTRYTLYYPPLAAGVSSVYANVAYSGNRVGAFEVGDMSIRINEQRDWNLYTNFMPIEREPGDDGGPATPKGSSIYAKITDGKMNPWKYNNAYCYIVSLNPPEIYTTDPTSGWPSKNAPANTSPMSITTGYGLTTPKVWNDTQFVYVCPSSVVDYAENNTWDDYAKDYYWGRPFPSSQYNVSSITGVPTDTNQIAYGTAPKNSNIVTQWVTIQNDPLYPLEVKPFNTDYIDPGQECRISVSSAPGYGVVSGYSNGLANSSPIEPLYSYGSPRMPFNAAYGDRLNTYDTTKGTWQYWSRHGWRCNWDFDSDYDPRFNPLRPGSNEPLHMAGTPSTKSGSEFTAATNNGTSYYGNGKVEPFFHLTDWTWKADGSTRELKPGTDGKPLIVGSSNAVVRGGTYMLHVQTYGGSGSNHYSVKAEYENAVNVTFTVGYSPDITRTPITKSIKPVPSVFGITTFSIYTNAQNPNDSVQDVVFDLAYIPSENAGATAILQLFDPGDVASDLQLSLREPSPSGNRLNSTGQVMIGNPISVSVQACPYYLSNVSACKPDTTLQRQKVDMTYPIPSAGNRTQYFNDQWVILIFQIPNKAAFDNYLNLCQGNSVPEEACYYFQVDYEQQKGSSNDATTWQLQVQGAPVRLLR
jgi:hypothetical protein